MPAVAQDTPRMLVAEVAEVVDTFASIVVVVVDAVVDCQGRGNAATAT